jgi:3-oxoacyl-[acyl-carrier-protein] synthase-3
MDKVFLTVQQYGNMSAATVPVALVDAIEAGRVRPGATILMPGFGGGLTLCSHLVRWGERVTPLAASDAQLPACTRSALELVNAIRARKRGDDASNHGLAAPRFAEASLAA